MGVRYPEPKSQWEISQHLLAKHGCALPISASDDQASLKSHHRWHHGPGQISPPAIHVPHTHDAEPVPSSHSHGEAGFKVAFDEATTVQQLLGMGVGAASMCWEFPERAGVFDTAQANAVVDAMLARLRNILFGVEV